MKNTLIFLFLLLVTYCCRSQQTSIDSSSFISFENLKTDFFKNELNNIDLANKIANSYILKAKKEKDTFHLGYGYVYKSYLNEFDVAVTYTDSIINLTKGFRNIDFPALGYMLKGYYFFEKGDDDKALEFYLKAYDYSLKNKNIKQQIQIKQFIGGVKTSFGQYDEALRIFREQFYFIKSQADYFIDYKDDYKIVLNDLSKAYLRGGQLDSARIMIDKGLRFSLKDQDSVMYRSFLLDSGSLLYYEGEYKGALDSLTKVEPYLESVSLANCYYYQGKIYKEKEITKTIFFYNKIDSIYAITKNPFLELKDVYRTLYQYYSNQNNIEKKIYTVDRLISIDSILSKTIKNVNKQVVNNYQIPKLKSEKESLIEMISEERSDNNIVVTILILVLIAIIVFLKVTFNNKKKYKQRFDDLLISINTENKKVKKEEVVELKSIDISKDVVDRVLKELKNFENKNLFLNTNITLNKLAKSFKTNSVYLSKIVNHYRELSFSNYLIELRISYCLEELNTNHQLRAYTVKAIGKEVGFNSAESFSKAFFKQTGLKPSFYIKQLNKTARN